MTNDKRMTALTKAAAIFSKIFEVGYFVGAVCMVATLVLFLVARQWFPDTLVKSMQIPEEAISVHGFSIVFGNLDGTINPAAVIIFLLTGALVLGLMAWIFRNVNLILRTTQGLTKFAEGQTPFQKANVRMMREIGIFFISITVVEIIMCAVAMLAVGIETAEISADLGGLITGVLMLCLSQVFAVGMQMQKDIDGLV